MPTKIEKRYARQKGHMADVDPVYGDWRLHENGFERVLMFSSITHLLDDTKIQAVPIDQICFKQHPDVNLRGKNCSCCDGARYERARIEIPCIVLEGLRNPANKPYGCIDGKHRMQKQVDQGKTDAKVLVLKFADIEKYYEPIF